MEDPYRIEGLHFSFGEKDSNLIEIDSVNAHFRISNNYLNGLSAAGWGISLWNCRNGIIEGNFVNNIWNGISLYFSNGIIVRNNTMVNSDYGIRLEANSDSNFVVNNTISYSQDTGIWIGNASNNNTISHNIIIDNSRGISLTNDFAIYEDPSIEGTENTDNSILYNLISNNFQGTILNELSSNNTIAFNSFNGNSNQASDFGQNNKFESNFWSDWDGIGQYSIYRDNFDAKPQPIDESEINLQDFDNDGIPNYFEYENGLNPFSNDALKDLDDDGLSNLEEYQNNTLANKIDSDNDGILDKYELKNDLNPRADDSLKDRDGDWISNFDEFVGNSEANNFWSVPILSISIFHFSGSFIVLLSILIFLGLYISIESKKREKLIKQLNAPNYLIAKSMKEGNFEDFDVYLEAQLLGIKTMSDYILMLELQNLERKDN